MARLVNFAIFLIVLQVVMLLFFAPSPIPSSSSSSSTISTNAFWDVAMHPERWNSLQFFEVLFGIAAGIIPVAMLIGAIAGLKTDFMVFAAIIPALVTLGFPIANFAMLLNSNLGSLFCGSAITNCPAAQVFVVLIAGSMALYYVFCILDFWRGK